MNHVPDDTKKDLCAYCLSDKPDTNDHIIPRGWFPKEDPIKVPLIVRACHNCNNAKSKNDEWLRKWFVSMISDRSPDAMEILYGPIARSIRRLPVLGEEIKKQMALVDVYSKPSGLWLGRKTRIEITDEHWSRILGWVSQVVMGLYAWDKKEPLSADYSIETFYACDEWLKPKELFKPILAYIPYPKSWHLEDANVFMFGRAYVPEEPQSSIWATSFYNQIMFLSFIGKHEWIEARRKESKKNEISKKDVSEKYDFRPTK